MEIPESKRFIPKGFELGTTLSQPNRSIWSYDMIIWYTNYSQPRIEKLTDHRSVRNMEVKFSLYEFTLSAEI